MGKYRRYKNIIEMFRNVPFQRERKTRIELLL